MVGKDIKGNTTV